MKDAADRIKNILNMDTDAVGVRFFNGDQEIPEGLFAFEPEQPLKSYCQAITGAARGQTVLAAAGKLGCTLGTATLGLEKDPRALLEESVHEKHQAGLYGSEQASRTSVDGALKFDAGSHRRVLICPLSSMPLEPQVVILEVNPEEAMWLLYAANYKRGGLQALPQAGGVSGGCADVTVFPLKENQVNITFLGLGCRLKSSIPKGHLFFGMPGSMLGNVAENLDRMAKPIARLTATEPFRLKG